MTLPFFSSKAGADATWAARLLALTVLKSGLNANLSVRDATKAMLATSTMTKQDSEMTIFFFTAVPSLGSGFC
jgi:hypothetical protein